MTVTATIKLTIITIFAPTVSIHKEHVFLFSKYKEIHRMILYTTYNKYCVSYILLGERVCGGFVRTPLRVSFFFPLVDFLFHIGTLHESLPPTLYRVGVGGMVEGASDVKLGSSCLYLLLLLLLLPVMPAVAGLLLLLELLQVFGLEGAQQGVSKLPVVLAVLIDQGHLRLAEDGQKVLVLASAGGPLGAAGMQRRWHNASCPLHQHVVYGPAGQHNQLQLDQQVFEVLLCGRALVHAGVGGLQSPQEEPLFCLQNPAVGAHLHKEHCYGHCFRHLKHIFECFVKMVTRIDSLFKNNQDNISKLDIWCKTDILTLMRSELILTTHFKHIFKTQNKCI